MNLPDDDSVGYAESFTRPPAKTTRTLKPQPPREDWDLKELEAMWARSGEGANA